jgi:hypothetical protein
MGTRTLIASIAIVVGLVLVGTGALLPNTINTYWPAVALEIGATLFLIPIVLAIERKLSNRLDEIRTSLNKESQATMGADSIGLDADWDNVILALERVWLRALRTEVYVKLNAVDAWLGFATFKQYQQGIEFTPVHIYYRDPTQKERPKLDSTVPWQSGMTGRQLMERVANTLQADGRFPGRDKFDPKKALDELRNQVATIVYGRDR